MPDIDGQKFPYTAKGMKQAEAARKKKKKKRKAGTTTRNGNTYE